VFVDGVGRQRELVSEFLPANSARKLRLFPALVLHVAPQAGVVLVALGAHLTDVPVRAP
jgi:hypothetical protein